jgi:ABC-type molybdate transport system substrate-binding protein
LVVASTLTSPVFAADVVVYAAGSLRVPLTEVAREFERATGNTVTLTFGASGLLRDRINSGERVDVFASANMEHPQSLAALGWTPKVERFARNKMCLLAAPNIELTTETALVTMLNPRVKVGTSTPKADPSGDYAWEVFRKANRVEAGAFATLSAKARQLTGGPQSPPPPSDRNVYGSLVANGDADIFLTYCTNAEQARQEMPAMRVIKLPAALGVGADYGVAVRHDASMPARDFAAYLRSADGFKRLASYGFDPP